LSDGRATVHDTTFETGLLPTGLMLPAIPLGAAILAWVANAPIVTLIFGGFGALVAALYGGSKLRIDGGTLTVRMLVVRGRSVRLDELADVCVESAAPSLWQAPALRIVDRGGRRLSVCLGWWRRESDFLARLGSAVAASGARTDPQVRQILRRRPPGMYWSVERQRMRGQVRARPFTRRPIDRAMFGAGLASIVFGLAYVIGGRSEPGSFGLVAEAIIGFQAAVLGGILIALARPIRSRQWSAAGSWLLYTAAVVSSLATLIVALDGLATPLAVDRSVAAGIVLIGRIILTFGITAEVLWLCVTILGALGRRFRSAGWGVRWLR
jgi:hypothetical protein